MDARNSVQESADAVRRLWEKHGVKKPFRLLGFCLSLLPIPVIQQAGMVLDRHLSDKGLAQELEKIWNQIEQINHAVAKVDTLELAISEIAKTVRDDEKLRAECERLSGILASTSSEFVIDTSGQSYQELANSVVQAGRVLISATGASTNLIENTKVQSLSTHLHASSGSRNVLNGATFSDGTDSVGMHGISTRGNIHLTGSSVGFGVGGALTFGGGNPYEVTANCPICRQHLRMDSRNLIGYSKVKCVGCGSVLPFTVR